MQILTKRKLKKLIPILILLIISIFLITNYKKTPHPVSTNVEPSPLQTNLERGLGGEVEESIKNLNLATLEINSTKYQTEISENISIYNFMNKLKEENKIDFKEKNYTAMGAFIEEINNIKNSGEQNWIYYVNNQKANIGISNYQIKPGDVVSWKYEKSL